MGWRDGLRLWGADLLDMFFPRCCEVCDRRLVRGEEVICLKCDYEMPRCRIHTDKFNTIHQRLAGHVPIHRAAGYFYYYRSTSYTRLILDAKYAGRPVIARTLARRFAAEISPDGFFDGIDVIIPVPLHTVKLMKRGYNQAEYIARGIADTTGIKVGEHLRARRGHATQTRRGAFERWINSKGIYQAVDTDSLRGRHLLVVDDVVTSGATLLACCEALHAAVPDATISVLTLGVTAMQ